MANGNGNVSLSHSILGISLTALLGLIGWLIFSTNAKLDSVVTTIYATSQEVGQLKAVQQSRGSILSDYEARIRLLESTVVTQHDALEALTKAETSLQSEIALQQQGRRR